MYVSEEASSRIWRASSSFTPASGSFLEPPFPFEVRSFQSFLWTSLGSAKPGQRASVPVSSRNVNTELEVPDSAVGRDLTYSFTCRLGIVNAPRCIPGRIVRSSLPSWDACPRRLVQPIEEPTCTVGLRLVIAFI